MISSKYLIGVFMTSFGCHVLFLCNYFVCTYFFVDVCHHDCCLLRNLNTYKKLHFYLVFYFLESTLFIFYSMVTPKSIFLVSVCLILLHLVHSFVFEDFCLSCLPRWACWFQCLVEPCLMLHSSFCIFSWC